MDVGAQGQITDAGALGSLLGKRIGFASDRVRSDLIAFDESPTDGDRQERMTSLHRQFPIPLVAVALAFAALQIASGMVEPYGLFHDELYYWAGAQRPGFGYVDHPPLAPWLLALAMGVLGDGPFVFSLLPALAGAFTILLVGRTARSFGAGVFGQTLAGLSFAVSPIVLAFFSFYSVNTLELLLWTAETCLFIELIRTGDRRLWLALGVVAGLGLLNKHTYALLCAGLAVGVLATPLRMHLLTRWPWWGASIAFCMALPNLVWNAMNGWPSLEFYLSRPEIDLPATVADALEMQIIVMNPVNVLIWSAGLWFLLSSRTSRAYRAPAIAFLVLFVVILVSGAKRADRIAGIYPVVLAAGATWWDQQSGSVMKIVRALIAASLVVLGILMLPMSIPLLSPDGVARYFEWIDESPEIETSDVGQNIPLLLNGRLGYERFANVIADSWDSLPEEMKARTVVLTHHWAFASVIEYHARHRGIGPVVAPHNAYWFWRGEAEDRDAVLAVGIPRQVLSHYFEQTREVGFFHCEFCSLHRADMPILLATGPVRPLDELLTDWRHFSIRAVPRLEGRAPIDE
jgi:hypothetical protein